MQEYITTVSKYVLTLCMGFYTLDALLVLRHHDESEDGFLFIRQNFWMFAIQLIGFFNVAILSREKIYIVIYGSLQIFIFLVLCITPLIYKKINRLLLNNMCMLMSLGMLMIARLNPNRSIRQFQMIAISYVVGMVTAFVVLKARFLSKMTWIYAIAGIVPLFAVYILGNTTLGAKISFTFGGITFQPSEFVKILFVLFVAAYLYKNTSFKKIVILSFFAGIHVLILVFSRDLGGALIFFISYILMVFIATGKYMYLFLGMAGASLASVMAYKLFSHVRIRILAWTNPWTYIDNQGYQITQSLFAIGSGSWFGMGLYQGTPDDIPYVEEDFIFSSICEEFGTIFGICLLLVILSCFIMIMKIALRCYHPFYRYAAYGFGIIYIFQIFLTVGGGIRFVPITGVTLPFISYGGSSLLASTIMFFIVQGIYMLTLKYENKKISLGEEKIQVTDREEIDTENNKTQEEKF